MTAPPRPRVWPAFVGWIIAAVAGTLLGIPFMGVALFVAMRDRPHATVEQVMAGVGELLTTPTVLIAGVTGNVMALSMVAVLGGRWTRERPDETLLGERLLLGPSTLSIPRVIVTSIGALGVSLASFAVVHLLRLDRFTIVHMMDDVFAKTTIPELVVVVLFVGGLGPLSEELLFRGYMQPIFVRRWGPKWGIALSALAFGITHLDPIQGTFAAMVGVFLGWLTQSSRSLRPAIAAHVLNNTIAVVASRFGGGDSSVTATLVTGGIGLVMLAVAILAGRQRGAAVTGA